MLCLQLRRQRLRVLRVLRRLRRQLFVVQSSMLLVNLNRPVLAAADRHETYHYVHVGRYQYRGTR